MRSTLDRKESRTPCLRGSTIDRGRAVPISLLHVLGVEPILQEDGRRVAYGMYNVGLLSRLLGGSLHVTEQGASIVASRWKFTSLFRKGES